VRPPASLEDVVLHGPLVDTHEHLLSSAELERRRPDLLVELFDGYLSADLISAGASREAVDRLLDSSDPDLAGRFAAVEQAWLACRHTGFGRAAAWIAHEAYGLDALTAERLAEARFEPLDRITVLRDRAGLDHVQVDDMHWRCEPDPEHPEFFLQDISWLLFATGDRRTGLHLGGTDYEGVAETSGIEITDLRSLDAAMEWVMERYGTFAVALKSQHAYVRGLAYEPRDDAAASRALSRVLADAATEADRRCVGDWALARGARLAAERGLPFKLHTGYLAGNEGMSLDDLRPGLLAPLLRAFPQTRFVLMHLAYPFAGEAVALAKHFPNAYLDWCWAWSLDPVLAGRALRSAIHAVPANKLLLFGGDARYANVAWAYAVQARAGLLAVLCAELGDGLLSAPDAERMARRLMYENQLDLFRPPSSSGGWSTVGTRGRT
jgi:uncharacterized protein